MGFNFGGMGWCNVAYKHCSLFPNYFGILCKLFMQLLILVCWLSSQCSKRSCQLLYKQFTFWLLNWKILECTVAVLPWTLQFPLIYFMQLYNKENYFASLVYFLSLKQQCWAQIEIWSTESIQWPCLKLLPPVDSWWKMWWCLYARSWHQYCLLVICMRYAGLCFSDHFPNEFGLADCILWIYHYVTAVTGDLCYQMCCSGGSCSSDVDDSGEQSNELKQLNPDKLKRYT